MYVQWLYMVSEVNYLFIKGRVFNVRRSARYTAHYTGTPRVLFNYFFYATLSLPPLPSPLTWRKCISYPEPVSAIIIYTASIIYINTFSLFFFHIRSSMLRRLYCECGIKSEYKLFNWRRVKKKEGEKNSKLN